MKRTPTVNSWAAMIARCTYPKHPRFKRYGGRGIQVCKRWRVFRNFLADMGERPTGTTLDRFPNKDGHYEPSNCRWATPTQQNNNCASNRTIDFRGERLPLTAWANRLGISREALRDRLDRGWSVDAALTTPTLRTRTRKSDGTFEASAATVTP